MSKLSVVVEEFTPRHSNTLRGFATVTVPELHLRIHDIGIHAKGDARWVALPGKPQVRDGLLRRDEHGKLAYATVIEFTDRATRDAFSHRVIEALLVFAPAAFADAEVAP